MRCFCKRRPIVSNNRCCHSLKIKNPRWTNEKPKVKCLCSWQKFHEKVNFSSQNPTFPEKSVFCPPKFLMTFLVVSSDFSNFHPVFVKSYRKPLLIPYF